MRKLISVSLIVIQSCVAFAQNCCVNDSTIQEIQSPLTEQGNTHNQAQTSHNGVNKREFINPDLPAHYLNGGDEGLLSDLYTIILETAPVTQDSVKGRAAVRFIISKDGQVDINSIKVIRNRSVPDDYLKAAIEAIKKLGKFEPAKRYGKPLKMTYIIPVIYPIPIDKINTVE